MEQSKLSLTEFENLLDKLRKKRGFYYYKHLDEKTYTLYLANGDVINYSIPEKVIPHLLGVDTNYLSTVNVLGLKAQASAEVFDYLLNDFNTLSLQSNLNRGIIFQNQLFSDYINLKIDAFEENIVPNIYNMISIVKIDRDICHYQGKDIPGMDYFFVTRNESGQYMLLGLVKEGSRYVARTSMLYDNLEELNNEWKDVFQRQETTYCYRLTIKNYVENNYTEGHYNFSLYPNQKIEKIDGLQNLATMWNSTIAIHYDYKYSLKFSDNIYNIGKNIADCMRNGQTVSEDSLGGYSFKDIPNYLKDIIDAYNDALCSSGKKSGEVKYSEMSKDYNEQKRQLEEMKKTILDLREENEKLSSENESLTKQSKEYEEDIVGIQKILSKYEKRS